MRDAHFERAYTFLMERIAGEMQTSGGGRFRSRHTNDETVAIIAASWEAERTAERERCIAELLSMPGDGIITKYEAARMLRTGTTGYGGEAVKP